MTGVEEVSHPRHYQDFGETIHLDIEKHVHPVEMAKVGSVSLNFNRMEKPLVFHETTTLLVFHI